MKQDVSHSFPVSNRIYAVAKPARASRQPLASGLRADMGA